MMFRVAWESLKFRRRTLIWVWVILVLALSTVSLMDRISQGAKQGFLASSRGVDLVIGKPDGDVQMVLSSIFTLGIPGGGISLADRAAILALPDIEQAVPIALGDSHRGFPVVSTDIGAMLALRLDSRGQPLTLADGSLDQWQWNHVVIGSEVAEQLEYRAGQSIRVSHGTGTGLEKGHPEEFLIRAILARSGTPLDRSVLSTMESGVRLHADIIGAGGLEATTALLIKAKRKVAVFRLQGQVDQATQGRAKAVLPGLALTQLWTVFGVVEKGGLLIGGIVLLFAVIATVGLTVVQVQHRRRELFVLRSMGASHGYLFRLLSLEGLIIALTAVCGAIGLVSIVHWLAGSALSASFGIDLSLGWLTEFEWALAVGCGVLCLASAYGPLLSIGRTGIQRGLTESSV